MSNVQYFTLGEKQAPLQFELYWNVACQGTAKFYKVAYPYLKELVEAGEANVTIKLWDKPKIELVNGLIAHLSLDYTNANALEIVETLIKNQEQWVNLSQDEVKAYLLENHNLTEVLTNTKVSLAVTAETIEKDIFFLPGIIINGELYLFKPDYTIEDIKTAITIIQAAVKA